jgi:integrase
MPKQKHAKRRSPKGSPYLHYKGTNRIISIRLTRHGETHSLALGLADNPENRRAALGICAQISSDIAFQRFGGDLAQYRPNPEPQPDRTTTLAIWDQYIETLRAEGASAANLAGQFKSIRSHLVRFGSDIKTEQDVRALFSSIKGKNGQPAGAATLNGYRTRLKSFGNWAAKQGSPNPFEGIKSFKDAMPLPEKVPFTLDEIATILAAFRTHPIHWYYYDFVIAWASLGTRPSEAIGLRWRHINWTDNTITIAEQMVRKPTGQPGATRQGKRRKNGVTTVIDLVDPLLRTLKGRHTPECNPNDLIFTGSKGGPINDGYFSGDVWKPILEAAGIPHRPPYLGRHSMISHVLDQGGTLPDAAYLAGHKSLRMVAQVYAKVVKRPQLPRTVS